MTKRELIKALEALDVDDDTEILLDEDWGMYNGLVSVDYIDRIIYLCNK